MGAGGISGAEHGAEIAGLFNVFANDDEGIAGENQVRERPVDLGAEGEEAFGAVTVGNLAEDDVGALEEGDIELGTTGDEGGLVLTLVEGGAKEELGDGDMVVECALDFTVALDNEQSGGIAVGALAKFDDFLDAGILEAGDELGGHGAEGGSQCPIFNMQV